MSKTRKYEVFYEATMGVSITVYADNEEEAIEMADENIATDFEITGIRDMVIEDIMDYGGVSSDELMFNENPKEEVMIDD